MPRGLHLTSIVIHYSTKTTQFANMVKALHFKGDKKVSKKRKRAQAEAEADPTSQALTTTTTDEPPRNEDAADEDDTWVTADVPLDITGPIILLLPSTPPSAISCDATGTIFPIPIENIVEDDPATSEPHDVRQVWIANRVARTAGHSFKGHHGKYLSCDKFGILSAVKEAVGPEEQFDVIAVNDLPGAFAIQTAREKFIEIEEARGGGSGTGKIRGDAETIQFTSTLRIRMQARFKPKLKVAKEEKAHQKISRKELEDMVGRKLEDADVKILKRARREGDFGEKLLDVKIKGKHDKFA
jgi:protein FRG1